MRAGADLHGRFRVDQVLQAGLRHPPEHVGVGQVGVGEDFNDQGPQGRRWVIVGSLLCFLQETTGHSTLALHRRRRREPRRK